MDRPSLTMGAGGIEPLAQPPHISLRATDLQSAVRNSSQKERPLGTFVPGGLYTQSM